MDTTPFTLLECLRRPGDQDAWQRFVALAAPFLFDVARRWGLQDADAADVGRKIGKIETLYVSSTFASTCDETGLQEGPDA